MTPSKKDFGETYQNYLKDQRQTAFTTEQLLPDSTRRELNAARVQVLQQDQAQAAAIQANARQAVIDEAPLHTVELNADLKDPANFAKLEPGTGNGTASQAQDRAAIGSTVAQSTFATPGSPAYLRQQLEAERQHAGEIDRQNQQLETLAKYADPALKFNIVVGKEAAKGLGYLRYGPEGAAVAGAAYSAITAGPDVILGNKTLKEATGEYVGEQGAEMVKEAAGVPPVVGVATDFVDEYGRQSIATYLHLDRTLDAVLTK